MNDDFTFEQSAWELKLDKLKWGDVLMAEQFLALLEGEEEDAVAQALQDLEDKHITLCADNLSAETGTGMTQKRLEWEKTLVSAGALTDSLPEGDPLKLYLDEIAAVPVAGDPEVLAQSLLEGNREAAQRLADLTISRAISAAQEMAGRGVLLMDLIQEASLGMWKGILEYRGGSFDNHVDWWIRQYLAAAVTVQARANGVGRTLREGMEAYRAADRALLTRIGRNPTVEEIAQELGVPVETAQIYEETLSAARTMEKVKQQQPQEDPDDAQAVENTAYFQSRQRIDDMLSALTEQQVQVVTLRFGLDGNPPCDPQTVAQKLSMTADQVLTVEAQALEIMRNKE